MKKKTGAVIFVFLAGIILGAVQPALLYAASTSGGYVWDQFVDNSPFTWGTKLAGPLSIYYFETGNTCTYGDPPTPYYKVVLYMTVRLTYKGVNYTFSDASSEICFLPYDGQWEQIKVFLTTAVGGITNCNSDSCWKLKSIDNPKTDTGPGAFVADITIGVK